MTGNLLSRISGEKPKEPPENGNVSSDDETRAMLAGGCKAEGEDGTRARRGPGWGWGFALQLRQLPNWIPQRVVLCILAHLGFVVLYVIRSAMSIAIVRMTAPYAVLQDGHLVEQQEFDWTLQEQGFVLSAFFVGYICTQIPGGYWAMKLGGRSVFGLGLFLASLASACTPVVTRSFGFYGLLIVRYLCGLFEGVTYPAIHAMWNHWAPPKERATLVSFAFSGAYIGAAMTVAQLSKASSLTSGWEEVFYLSGVYALLWSFIWFSWGAEYPEYDTMISNNELNYISETIGFPNKNNDLPVPWMKILLSHRVWAISLCHFAANWGFYTILTELPTFLTKAFGFSGKELTAYASFPFLAMAVTAACGGLIVDKTLHRVMNTTMTRKVTVALTFVGQMMFFFLAGKATDSFECIIYISAAMGFCGLCWAGFGANHLDIAPEYASILLGVTNTFGTLPGILSPIVTGFFVKDPKSVESWSIMFLCAGYIYLAAALYYVMFGTGERQDWANPSESVKLNTSKKQEKNADAESGSD